MSNDTNLNQTCLYIPKTWPSFMFLVMIMEVVVGLPGNLLALWIFCFRVKAWKPHTVFLFSLMLADVLVLASVPFRIDTHLRGEHWVYGEVFCRVNLFMLAVNRSASIGFMTIITLNSYFKVLHPFHCVSLMSLRHAVCLSLLIWVITAILRIPLLTTDLLHVEGNLSVCRSFIPNENPPMALTIHYFVYITEFILPWILLMFCSTKIIWYLKRQQQVDQQKKFKKAIRSVAVINLVFIICFLPAIITGLGCLVIKRFQPNNCEVFKKMSLAFTMCIGLTYLNSTLDPAIYIFSSSVFRTALKDVFKKLWH